MKRRALAVLLVAAAPAVTMAQRVTITPTIGAMVPASALYRWSIPCVVCDVEPIPTNTVRMSLEPGLALGIAAAARLTSAFGVEIGITTTTTHRRMSFEQDGNLVGTAESRLAAARHTSLVLRATMERSLSEKVVLGFGVGASHTTLSSDALLNLAGDSIGPPFEAQGWGASFAARLGFALSRRTQAHFSITDNVYRAQAEPTPSYSYGTGEMQHDFLLSIGLAVGLLH